MELNYILFGAYNYLSNYIKEAKNEAAAIEEEPNSSMHKILYTKKTLHWMGEQKKNYKSPYSNPEPGSK